MAEFSGRWTSSGTPVGHQQASYTQSQDSLLEKSYAGSLGFEGVVTSYLNSLAGTVTGANTVSINTGGAVVDGKAYNNSAAVSVNIPSSVGGGNTRIDRIVLRANWAGFTVLITRIAGTDAGSPTAPAITQTSGTTYDIPLYKATVNTSGTVTLTDERQFAQVQAIGLSSNSVITATILDANVTTNKLADSAVSTIKIASGAVDFSKMAANVVITNRQGGHATDWTVPGSTNYLPGTVKIQVGCGQINAGTNTTHITFPFAFSNLPVVFITPFNLEMAVAVNGVASMDVQTMNGANAVSNQPFFWMAVGTA